MQSSEKFGKMRHGSVHVKLVYARTGRYLALAGAAMSGLNGNLKELELVMRPSTMGSVLVKIQPPCKRSASGSDLGR
jgi:hypothetical protein